MELTKYAQAVKTELIAELHKQGSNLAEFEAALQAINTGEGVHKIASFGSQVIEKAAFATPNPIDIGTKATNWIGGAMDTAIKGSVVGGTMAGLSMDEMDKSVDSVNKALAREREKVNLVRRLTQNLRLEHGLT